AGRDVPLPGAHSGRVLREAQSVFALTQRELGALALSDIQRYTAQADNPRLFDNRTKIVFYPANAPVLCQPAKFTNAVLTTLNDCFAFVLRFCPILFGYNSEAKTGCLFEPFGGRVTQHLLQIVADKGCLSPVRNRVCARFPDDSGNVRNYFSQA